MNATHVLILSVVCIIAGVVLTLFDKGEALAAILIAAGAGGLAKEISASNRRSRESAKKAAEALEATQTLRRDMLGLPPARRR